MSDDPAELLPLTSLEFRVLLVLAESPLHGYAIAKEVERRDPGLGRIYPTNLYRRLKGMAADGLIAEADDASPDATDSRRGRCFQITPFGVRVAKLEARRLEAAISEARRSLPGGLGSDG